MRRLAVLGLLGSLAIASGALAYDGPNPVTYDRTIETIRVVITAPGRTMYGGKTRLLATAYVPVTPESIGQTIDFEVREANPEGDYTLVSCSYTPEFWEVGQTIVLPCDVFATIPHSGFEGDEFELYPYVLRRATGFPGDTYHWGRDYPLIVAIQRNDDAYEANDTLDSASPLEFPGQIALPDLVSLDGDYYRIVVPYGATSAAIRIDFWHDVCDLDLYVYNAKRYLVKSSATYTDGENVTITVTAGAVYYIYVRNYGGSPAFYDLAVTFSPLDLVVLTSGPTGTPNPVASGAAVALSAQATDTLNHPVSYAWQATCPSLSSHGTFTPSAAVATPTWTAPVNLTGAQQACTVTVTATDGGTSASGSYVQHVASVPDRVTIVSGASGDPEPVSSSGSVQLSVLAEDSLGHPLVYSWQVACAGLTGTGSLSPGPSARTPNLDRPAQPDGCRTGVRAHGHHQRRAWPERDQRARRVESRRFRTQSPSRHPRPGRPTRWPPAGS